MKGMELTFKVGITFESVDEILIPGIKCFAIFFESKIWEFFQFDFTPVKIQVLFRTSFRVFVMLQTLPTSSQKVLRANERAGCARKGEV